MPGVVGACGEESLDVWPVAFDCVGDCLGCGGSVVDDVVGFVFEWGVGELVAVCVCCCRGDVVELGEALVVGVDELWECVESCLA